MTDRSTPDPDGTAQPEPADDGTAAPRPPADEGVTSPEATAAAERPAADPTEDPEIAIGREDDRRSQSADRTDAVTAEDDIPREPSKYELDAGAKDDAVPPVAPPLDTSDPDAEPLKPKRAAVAMLGLLAAVMLALGVIGTQQSSQSIYDSYNPAQITAMATILKDANVRDYTEDEIAAVKEVWATEDHPEPTNEEIAAAFNQGTNASGDDAITAAQVDDALGDRSLALPSREDIDSNLRTQIIIYFASFALAALSAFFYAQGRNWARAMGMFVSGVVAIMWGMQAVQAGFQPLILLIAVIGAVSFYYLMKGRLIQPAAAGGPGLGSFFSPRRKREE